jgi:enoyl-CoA hydratase
MSVYLPMAVGLRRAKEMSLTGNFVDATEAHRIGLVNHVVGHDELLSTARSLAVDIAANDGPTVRHLKGLYDHNAALSVGESIAHEQAVFREYRVDFDEIERRRAAIVDRGRSQT